VKRADITEALIKASTGPKQLKLTFKPGTRISELCYLVGLFHMGAIQLDEKLINDLPETIKRVFWENDENRIVTIYLINDFDHEFFIDRLNLVLENIEVLY